MPFIDLQKDTYQTYSCQGMELKICDEVKSLDFLINVPVMKGHCQTKITCALKNLKGLIHRTAKKGTFMLWDFMNPLLIWQQKLHRILQWLTVFAEIGIL